MQSFAAKQIRSRLHAGILDQLRFDIFSSARRVESGGSTVSSTVSNTVSSALVTTRTNVRRVFAL